MDKGKTGDIWQTATKYERGKIPAREVDVANRPAHLKVYEHAINNIPLPEPVTTDGEGLSGLLHKRRTRRTYKPEPLSMSEISQLLWSANGKTKEGRETFLRSAPSAGALYPIEMYLLVNRVDGLENGIYHYDPFDNILAYIKEGEFGEAAASAALGQAMLSKCGAVIFLTAVIERTRWKYGQRAYRYIYMDAGHIGQNICLAAEAAQIGTCPIGAFYDDEMNAILGVDGTEETVVYAFTLGR